MFFLIFGETDGKLCVRLLPGWLGIASVFIRLWNRLFILLIQYLKLLISQNFAFLFHVILTEEIKSIAHTSTMDYKSDKKNVNISEI